MERVWVLTHIIINYGQHKAEYSTLAHSRFAPRLLPLYLRETHCWNIGKKIRSNTIPRLILV